MPDYCGPERRETGCPDAQVAAKAAVREVFAILGVDIDSPREVEQFRISLRFGDSLRKAWGKGLFAFGLALVVMMAGAFMAGLKIKLGG